MRLARTKLVTVVLQLALFASLLLAWELASGTLVDELLVSRPTLVWGRFVTMFASGEVLTATLSTIWVVLTGLFWGTLAGVAVGVLLAMSQTAHILLRPVIDALFSIPKITLVPLTILWFGMGYGQRSILTAMVVFFFMFFATWNGVRRVPASLRATLLLLGASTRQLVLTLYLPASFGWILSGLRVSTPYAFVTAVSAEIISATDGIGALVKTSGAMMDSAGMFVGIVTVTFMAALGGGLVNLVHNASQRRFGSTIEQKG